MECIIEGCQRKHYARGWCRMHYARWDRNGDPLAPARRGRPPTGRSLCTVEGCDRHVKGHGFCGVHYARWRRHGDPLRGRVERVPNTVKVCEVDGCERPSRRRNMCPMHYARWQTHGDPGGPEPHYGNAGERFVTPQGYVLLWRPDHPAAKTRRGRVVEHRLVMEEQLGRPLLPTETVHHKNGVRDDNRPENLELWSSRHPYGQRVEDLVEFAREVLSLYG